MTKVVHDTIEYGTRSIEVTTTFVDRKTLEISVYPDQSVMVRAPISRSYDDVRDRVTGKARWIVKQQDFFRDIVEPIPPRQYVGGETHYYLGRQYRLKVVQISDDEDEQVKLSGPYFWIYTHDKAGEHVEKLLYGWYREKATTRFQDRLNVCADIVRKYGIDKPPMLIRRMRKRWGSWTPSRRILLNLELIKAPTYCIDYVLLHELCHARHPHHGPAFYELLSDVMPTWKQAKQRLEMVQG